VDAIPLRMAARLRRPMRDAVQAVAVAILLLQRVAARLRRPIRDADQRVAAAILLLQRVAVHLQRLVRDVDQQVAAVILLLQQEVTTLLPPRVAAMHRRQAVGVADAIKPRATRRAIPTTVAAAVGHPRTTVPDTRTASSRAHPESGTVVKIIIARD
jgi:hypothetical protein